MTDTVSEAIDVPVLQPDNKGKGKEVTPTEEEMATVEAKNDGI